MMPSLTTSLKKSGIRRLSKARSEPLWKGPEVDGITQSMLCAFLNCRERFRVSFVLGLGPPDKFDHRLGYGHMWHLCEEHLAMKKPWEKPLLLYCQEQAKKYKQQSAEINKWYNVCKRQFPVYVDYWKKHPDVKNRTPLSQEQVFRVPYTLPSGRTVWLRGKFDSVDIIGKSIYLQENKTKGDIKEQQLTSQLTFDPQTMFYLISLQEYVAGLKNSAVKKLWNKPLGGVRYNVIRRPFSGGKGSIKQLQGSKNRKAETTEEYYNRLLNDYIKAEPEYWFMRWRVEITQEHIDLFKQHFLLPILQQLVDWYDHVSTEEDPFQNNGTGLHWRHPYGVYNSINETGTSDFEEYLNTGSEVGLTRREKLFTELE